MTVLRDEKIYTSTEITSISGGIVLTVNSTISSVASTAVPLGIAGTYTSASFDIRDYRYIVGTCLADQNGTLYVQYSWDDINFDGESTEIYTANDKLCFKVPCLSYYAKISYINGGVGQGTFRLHWGLATV